MAVTKSTSTDKDLYHWILEVIEEQHLDSIVIVLLCIDYYYYYYEPWYDHQMGKGINKNSIKHEYVLESSWGVFGLRRYLLLSGLNGFGGSMLLD